MDEHGAAGEAQDAPYTRAFMDEHGAAGEAQDAPYTPQAPGPGLVGVCDVFKTVSARPKLSNRRTPRRIGCRFMREVAYGHGRKILWAIVPF
jgi:hypothetical protein